VSYYVPWDCVGLLHPANQPLCVYFCVFVEGVSLCLSLLWLVSCLLCLLCLYVYRTVIWFVYDYFRWGSMVVGSWADLCLAVCFLLCLVQGCVSVYLFVVIPSLCSSLFDASYKCVVLYVLSCYDC